MDYRRYYSWVKKQNVMNVKIGTMLTVYLENLDQRKNVNAGVLKKKQNTMYYISIQGV